MTKFTIQEHRPLEGASKTHAPNGEPASDTNPSEWAVAYCLQHFEIGQEVEEEEFYDKLAQAIIQQELDAMVANGELEAHWDPDQETFIYYKAEKENE